MRGWWVVSVCHLQATARWFPRCRESALLGTRVSSQLLGILGAWGIGSAPGPFFPSPIAHAMEEVVIFIQSFFPSSCDLPLPLCGWLLPAWCWPQTQWPVADCFRCGGEGRCLLWISSSSVTPLFVDRSRREALFPNGETGRIHTTQSLVSYQHYHRRDQVMEYGLNSVVLLRRLTQVG